MKLHSYNFIQFWQLLLHDHRSHQQLFLHLVYWHIDHLTERIHEAFMSAFGDGECPSRPEHARQGWCVQHKLLRSAMANVEPWLSLLEWINLNIGCLLTPNKQLQGRTRRCKGQWKRLRMRLKPRGPVSKFILDDSGVFRVFESYQVSSSARFLDYWISLTDPAWYPSHGPIFSAPDPPGLLFAWSSSPPALPNTARVKTFSAVCYTILKIPYRMRIKFSLNNIS